MSRKVITGGIVLVGALLIVLIIVIIRADGDANTNTNSTNTENVNTTTNTANTNTGDGDSAFETGEPITSDEAVERVLDNATSEWAEDAEVHVLTSVASPVDIDGTLQDIGFGKGKYSSWLVSLYSPSKGETVMGSMSIDGVVLTEPWGGDDAEYQQLEGAIQDLNDVDMISSAAAYTALVGQLDEDDYYYEMEIEGMRTDGLDLGTVGNQWKVTEHSRTDMDEYGFGAVNRTLYVDALSGLVTGE